MKNKKTYLILQVLLALVSLIIISCGDSGSSGSSSSSGGSSDSDSSSGSDSSSASAAVTIRLSGLSVRTASTDSIGAAAAPSYIRSIRVTVSGSDMDTVVEEAVLTSPLGVEIALEIPTGVNRLFMVEALDSAGLPMFAGQTYADLGATAITLDITLYDLIEQMMNSFVQTIGLSYVTPMDIDGYFSLDYGINDGKTRQEEIDKVLFDRNILALSVTNLTDKTVTALGDYLMHPVINKEDGSYERDTVIVAYENGAWKFKGNGFNSYAYLSAYNRMFTNSLDTVSYSGGIRLKIEASNYSQIARAVIMGPGLPGAGAILVKDSITGKFIFVDTSEGEFYPMSDAAINAIPANSGYTISLYSFNGALVETRTEILPYRPYMTTELSAAAFADLTNPTTATHDVLSPAIGGTVVFDYAMPAAYTAANINLSFLYMTNMSTEYTYFSAPLLYENSSAMITRLGIGEIPAGGMLIIKTMDSSFRNMYYFWEYVTII